MPTVRSFAYNSGSAIAGTTQVGSIAAGNTSANYGNELIWWNGPDEDIGYVITHTSGNRTAGGGTINVSAPTIGFWRSASKTDESFIALCNGLFNQGFTTASGAKSWLNTNGYWTSWESAGVSFVGAFVGSSPPTTTIETAWNTFRAALTGTYTQFVWSSTNGSSITVSHPTSVQTLANALKNATNNTSVTINSVVWRVGTGCGTPKIGGVAVEFSNIASCSASSTYALRPMINNANWGGTNQSTVNAPTQTITLTFS